MRVTWDLMVLYTCSVGKSVFGHFLIKHFSLCIYLFDTPPKLVECLLFKIFTIKPLATGSTNISQVLVLHYTILRLTEILFWNDCVQLPKSEKHLLWIGHYRKIPPVATHGEAATHGCTFAHSFQTTNNSLICHFDFDNRKQWISHDEWDRLSCSQLLSG